MSTDQVKNPPTASGQCLQINEKKLPIAGENVYTSGKKTHEPTHSRAGVGRGRNNVDRSCQGKVIMCTHKMVQRVVKVWSYRV